MTTRLELVKPCRAARDRPVFVRADEIRGRPDLDIEAIGNVDCAAPTFACAPTD